MEIKLPGKSGRPIADKVKCNLGEFARKVYIPGKSMCTLCNKLINYGNHFDTVCILVLESELNQNDIVICLLFNMEIHISKFSKFSQEITQELKICIN